MPETDCSRRRHAMAKLQKLEVLRGGYKKLLAYQKLIKDESGFEQLQSLLWVKAHNNNLYNDYADFYAKQAVYYGEVFSVPAPRSFLSSSVNKFILESWTSSWNDCNTRLRVKRFFNIPN
ncbi:hypothetical protein TNIN_354201 [Trichonephila inaurata madagascariensis]|uniref:Uncharacterized protein n=1 Tax=Trichonephila inaurata madagascariensis TaxID=2747483 RepID=A0A8X6XNE2_9ARAC|nr:hypothetical protein TNIN_354201 [Trichonephila inaurata madagascariensis]